MNPNGQAPLDYLNQIAPQAPKKQLFQLNLRTVLIGGAILVGLVILIAALSGALTGSRKEPWQRLSARLDATAGIATSASSEIKNSQLRSLNSSLNLYITNTKRDIATPLKNLDINADKLPAKVLADESNEKILARLEDGRLNAKYDTTYSREMGYQLALLLALLKEVYGSSSASTKEIVQTAYDNLSPIYESISGFDAAQ